jgi:TPR repeat protein
VFARRAPDPSYTLIAVAHAAYADVPPTSPEGLAELVRRRAPRVPDADRYEIMEKAVELDRSASWCVRYRLRAEDSRNSYFYPHIIRIAGRVCAHPGVPDLLIDASYAERAVEGETIPEALEEGEAFLAGVRLTPLHAAAVTRADALIARGSAEEPIKLLSPLAEQGYAPAAQMLGAAYEHGQGVPPNAEAANRWYLIAADAGEVDALYNLGALHDHTNDSVRDAQEALRWFLRAADQRDAQAQLNLGLLYLKGDGVTQDAKRARYWLELAGSNGNARARTLLRTLFP